MVGGISCIIYLTSSKHLPSKGYTSDALINSNQSNGDKEVIVYHHYYNKIIKYYLVIIDISTNRH